MRVHRQEDLKITKADIDDIQKRSDAMEKIDFDKWIAFEMRLQMVPKFSKSSVERRDIINALEHLQSIYEGKEKVRYRPISEIDDVVSVAHWDALKLNSLCEIGKAHWDDVMCAYDVYEIILQTQNYLDFNTSHYKKIK